MFDSIIKGLKQNRVGLSILSFAAAAAIGLALLNGCQFSDLIKVPVPRQVQKALGVPAKVTLTEAPMLLEDYRRYGAQFVANIDKGNEILGYLQSAADIGLRLGAATLPAGGLGLAALTGLGGLFLKGPGTQKGKEKSYEEGRKKAESMLLPLLTAAGIKVPDA